MSRLIDADKIDFNEVFGGQSDFAKDTRDASQSLIDAQPTVEAVTVVHCKDCKQWHKDIGWCDKHSHFINYQKEIDRLEKQIEEYEKGR